MKQAAEYIHLPIFCRGHDQRFWAIIRTWIPWVSCSLVVGVRTSRSCPRGLRPCGRSGATVLAAIYTLGFLWRPWASLPLLLFFPKSLPAILFSNANILKGFALGVFVFALNKVWIWRCFQENNKLRPGQHPVGQLQLVSITNFIT